MENSIININNTSYSIEEKWIQNIVNYFDIEGTDEEKINLLKAGLFGYNNEITSNEIKNNVYHRNVLYDEHFINSASIPKSIYNFAKTYNYEIRSAKPSHAIVLCSLKKDDVIKNSRKLNKNEDGLQRDNITLEYIISSDYTFKIQDYCFMLPYPIQILSKPNKKEKDNYAVIARYMYEEKEFPYMDIKSPFIKTWTEQVFGEDFLFLELDLYQMSKTVKSTQVFSEDISENLFYDFDYAGQLSHFNVYYEYKGEKILLKKYFNNTFNPQDEKYCFYTYKDNNRIEVSFSALPNSFRPRFNSNLIFEVFTTLGKKGNFKYKGKLLVNFSNDDNEAKIPMFIQSITDPSGGEDKPEMNENKNKIIEKFLVRKNLIMDSDLETYFNNVSKDKSVNNSYIKFIKKRNDVIKRLFNSYLLLRDREEKVMPTTTCPNIIVDKDFLIKHKGIIPDNTLVIYDINNDNYFFEFNTDNIEKYEDNPDKYLMYSLPYLIKNEFDPILGSFYYKTNINKNFPMQIVYNNPYMVNEFIINNVLITKNNIKDSAYKIELSMASNLPKAVIETHVQVVALIKSKLGKHGFIKFTKDTEKEDVYYAYLKTDNEITDGKMNITNSIYPLNSEFLNSEGTPIKNCFVPEAINFELGVLLKNEENRDKYGEFNKILDAGEYASCAVFKNLDKLVLFKNLSNLMESNIYPIEDSKTKEIKTFKLKHVPLFEYHFFHERYEELFDILDKYNTVILDSLSKLESNTNVDIKFYNTYGKSKYYEVIKRTDIVLNLNIHLKTLIEPDDDMVIQKFISDFVEECNENGLLPISNLIRLLEETFDIIKYIEFNSINGKDIQKLESSFTSFLDMTREEIVDYVPEYLNLRKDLDNDGNYRYNIKINYI